MNILAVVEVAAAGRYHGSIRRGEQPDVCAAYRSSLATVSTVRGEEVTGDLLSRSDFSIKV